MLKVGLTGNIGSGKSIIAGIFSVLQVPVYHADLESRQLLRDASVKESIRRQFGATIFTADGQVDRKQLGNIVFTDPEKLRILNDLLHPLVLEHFRGWCHQHHSSPYILHEAAILYESGIAGEFERVIHVACPEETAIGRVIIRDQTTREEVLNRMRFQLNEKEKATLADFIIRNDGSELVIPQVLDIHSRLLKISA
jgi:dephospho-CoA kinase